MDPSEQPRDATKETTAGKTGQSARIVGHGMAFMGMGSWRRGLSAKGKAPAAALSPAATLSPAASTGFTAAPHVPPQAESSITGALHLDLGPVNSPIGDKRKRDVDG